MEGRIVIAAEWAPYTRRELWESEQEMERLIDGAGPAMCYSQTPCACDTMVRGRAGASLPKVEVRKTVRRNRRIPPPSPPVLK